MASDETTAAGALPPWLDPDTEGAPPEALRMIYEKVPREVVQACERARSGMREGYVTNLLKARDALAPYGFFKEWCVAAGINYRTAQSIVYRAEQAKRPKPEPEQPTEPAMPFRPPAPPDPPEPRDDDDKGEEQGEQEDEREYEDEEGPELEDEPQPQPQPQPQPEKPEKPPKKSKIWFEYDDADEQQRRWGEIARVMKGHKLGREAALAYILDVFYGKVIMLAADAVPIMQAEAEAEAQKPEAA